MRRIPGHILPHSNYLIPVDLNNLRGIDRMHIYIVTIDCRGLHHLTLCVVNRGDILYRCLIITLCTF